MTEGEVRGGIQLPPADPADADVLKSAKEASDATAAMVKDQVLEMLATELAYDRYREELRREAEALTEGFTAPMFALVAAASVRFPKSTMREIVEKVVEKKRAADEAAKAAEAGDGQEAAAAPESDGPEELAESDGGQ